jgi:hypothetical protein
MNYGRIFAGNVIWLSQIRKIEKRKKRRRKGGAEEVVSGAFTPDEFFSPANESMFAGDAGDRAKGRSQTTVEITYRVDVAWKVCKGPGDVLRMYFNGADLVWDNLALAPGAPGPTGRFDPSVPPDGVYNPRNPPSRREERFWSVFGFRFNAPISSAGVETLPSGGKVRSGTLNVKDGGFIAVKSYPGTYDQPLDPTMQAEIDARRGPGSTSAHRGDIVVVVRDLNLTVYGNAIPNATFLVHSQIVSVRQIAEDLCRHAKLTPDQYDFTAWSNIFNRGFLIPDRTPPSQEFDALLRAYNLDIIEQDGKIKGIVRGNEIPMSIPKAFLGAEEEAEGKTPSRIELSVANPNELPRQLETRYYATPKLEPETAREFRRSGEFSREESLDLQMTFAPEEADAITKREFYRAHLESVGVSVMVPWRYCRIVPGQVATVETENGPETFRVQEIQGAVPGALKLSGPRAFIETGGGGS